MELFKVEGNWAFGKVADGYIALGAANGLDLQMRGDNAFRDLQSHGTPNIWLCQMGRTALDGTFDEFMEKVKALPVKFDNLNVSMTNLRGEEIQFGWEGPLLVNGEEQPLSGFMHYENPYCHCELNAPVMDIAYGDGLLRLHFEE